MSHHIKSEEEEFADIIQDSRAGRERTTFCYECDIEALEKSLSKMGKVI